MSRKKCRRFARDHRSLLLGVLWNEHQRRETKYQKKSLEELQRLLISLKKDRPIWSDQIDRLLKYLDAESMEKAEGILTDLKNEADGYPRNSSGMGWSERIKAILKEFETYAY